MKEYREKRLQQLKDKSAEPKFGQMIEIGKNQFELEVSRAPKDVIVILHLY